MEAVVAVASADAGLATAITAALRAKYGRYEAVETGQIPKGRLGFSGFQYLVRSCRGCVVPPSTVEDAWARHSESGAPEGVSSMSFDGFLATLDRLAASVLPEELPASALGGFLAAHLLPIAIVDEALAAISRAGAFHADSIEEEQSVVAAEASGSYAYQHAATSSQAHGEGTVFDRLTDARGYTGTHRHRFDRQGRGLGLRGRDSADVDYEWVKGQALDPGGAPIFTTNDPGSLAFGVRRHH